MKPAGGMCIGPIGSTTCTSNDAGHRRQTLLGELNLLPFEFILMMIAIVAGFAITEILRAWGVLIRERVPFRSAALYCYASLFLLAIIVRYTWLLWDLRAMEWQFLSFVLAFVPVLVLALAAFTISIPRGSTPNIVKHYFVQARPFYILVAVFLVVWSLGDVLALDYQLQGAGLPSVGRTIFVAVVLMLAFTRKEALHWLLLTVFFAAIIWVSRVAVPQL